MVYEKATAYATILLSLEMMFWGKSTYRRRMWRMKTMALATILHVDVERVHMFANKQ